MSKDTPQDPASRGSQPHTAITVEAVVCGSAPTDADRFGSLLADPDAAQTAAPLYSHSQYHFRINLGDQGDACFSLLCFSSFRVPCSVNRFPLLLLLHRAGERKEAEKLLSAYEKENTLDYEWKQLRPDVKPFFISLNDETPWLSTEARDELLSSMAASASTSSQGLFARVAGVAKGDKKELDAGLSRWVATLKRTSRLFDWCRRADFTTHLIAIAHFLEDQSLPTLQALEEDGTLAFLARHRNSILSETVMRYMRRFLLRFGNSEHRDRAAMYRKPRHTDMLIREWKALISELLSGSSFKHAAGHLRRQEMVPLRQDVPRPNG